MKSIRQHLYIFKYIYIHTLTPTSTPLPPLSCSIVHLQHYHKLMSFICCINWKIFNKLIKKFSNQKLLLITVDGYGNIKFIFSPGGRGRGLFKFCNFKLTDGERRVNGICYVCRTLAHTGDCSGTVFAIAVL